MVLKQITLKLSLGSLTYKMRRLQFEHSVILQSLSSFCTLASLGLQVKKKKWQGFIFQILETNQGKMTSPPTVVNLV